MLGEGQGYMIARGRCLVCQEESVDGSSRMQKEGVGWLFRAENCMVVVWRAQGGAWSDWQSGGLVSVLKPM